MLSSKEEKRLRNEFKHECELVQEEDVVVRYINSGCCVNVRRKIRDNQMASPSNPISKQYLKSNYVIRMERNRHLQFHYYMIHPFSKFRVWWEMFLIIVLILHLSITPVRIALRHDIEPLRWMILAFDLICMMDIIVTFNTGILNAKNNKIIMKRKFVAKRYILGWFVFDLISSLNIDIFWYLFTFLKIIRRDQPDVLPYLSYVKLLRISTVLRYIDRFRDYKQYSVYKFKLYKILLVMSFIFIWGTSCVYLVDVKEAKKVYHARNQFEDFLVCYQKVVYMILLFGYGIEVSLAIETIIIEMICITIGFIVQLIVIAQILQIVTKYSSAGNKYYQMTQQLEEYMRFKNLPESLRKRIFTYFDFRFQRNYYKENEILNTLSTRLRHEILMQSTMSLLENVNVFVDFPQSLLSAIVHSMRSEIYLPSDTIIHAGTPGDCMYFIATGTVAIFTGTGKEVCHLADGSNFGEISLIMESEPRSASVVAIDSCELFILTRKDFLKTMEPYPELYYRVRKMTQEKLKRSLLTSLGKEHDSDSNLSQVSIEVEKKNKSPGRESKTKMHYFI